MDFLKLAKSRYSVRSYEKREVEKEKLDMILEAGRVAPTAANRQAVKFLIITNDKGLEKLAEGVNFFSAPLAIIICADHSKTWIRPFDKKEMTDIDSAIIADHMVMQAQDIGLGTCWLTYFKPDLIREKFNIPPTIEPIAIIAIGYAIGEKLKNDRHNETRKAINELTVYESF